MVAQNTVTSNTPDDGYDDSGTSPPVDVDAAHAFFARRFGNENAGYAAFVFIHDAHVTQHLTHIPLTLKGFAGLPADANIYLSVASFATDDNRTEPNVLHLNCLYCEEDATPLPDTLPEPSYRVETSAGRFQSYWALDAPVDVATARRYIVAIADAVGIGHEAIDAARVLRLPGTINHKPEKNRFVVRFAEGSGATYRLADFAHLTLPPMPVEHAVVASAVSISDGRRNTTLTRTAGLLQRQGFDDAAIEAALLAENTAKCDPPLPDSEVLKIAHSIERYEKGEPIGKSEIISDLPANGYETFSPAALLNMKAVPFLIDGVIPLHGLVEIVGPSGSFKSFYALHVAADVASREDDPKNVLYVAAEGFFGIGQRLAAWQTAYRDIPEERFRLINVAPKLLVAADVDRVIATVRREHSQVIIVDTLARTMGGDENSTKDMTAYTDACGRISAETDALVIVVHHFGWNGERQRGSSVLFAAADAELTVNRTGDDLTEGVS